MNRASRRILGALLLALAALGVAAPFAYAQPSNPAAQPTEPVLPARSAVDDVVLHYTNRLIRNLAPTERDFNLLNLAYLENLGTIPIGWTDQVATFSADQPRERPPVAFLRDHHLICDVDADNVADLAANEIDLLTGRTSISVYSGADGHMISTRYNAFYVTPQRPLGVGFNLADFAVYSRSGNPAPNHRENFAATFDIDGDGVCDLLSLSSTYYFVGGGVLPTTIVNGLNTVSVLNASYLYDVITSATYPSMFILTDDPTNNVRSVEMVDFPTGFLHVTTPNGPRLVRKTTIAEYTRTRTGTCDAFDWRTQDQVHYHKIDNLTEMWKRDLPIARDQNPAAKSQEKVNNITYLAGAGQLSGDDEAEVVLDQFQFTTPFVRGNFCPTNNPVDGSPIFRFGRSVTVMTLRGEEATKGANLWLNMVYDQGTAQINTAFEENFEVLIWTYAYLMPDLNGDGVPEILASFLMQELNMATTSNGRYVTHVHMLDGASGDKLWPLADIKIQGWGFASGMNPDPEKSVPYFAFGAVDIPTDVPASGRFPAKDIRLAVYSAEDASTLWSVREQFSQDSYVGFDATLTQYRNALAPHDWDGDGLRDPVTPAEYVQPTGANQTLLSSSKHTYAILKSADGSPIVRFPAWGPTGIAQICKANDDTLTIFSGHARRLDISRYHVNGSTATLVWREPFFNQNKLQGATQATDLMFLGVKCIEGLDGRIAFSTNIGLASAKRGQEVSNVFGFADEGGDDLLWMLPPVEGKPPLDTEEILKFFEVEEPSPGLTLALTAGPALPGLAAGIGLARIRSRKRGSP